MLEYLSIVANVAGVLGLILTVVLLIRSETLHKIIAQKHVYNSDKDTTKLKLRAIRDGILNDEVFNARSVSTLRTLLYSSNEKFNRLNKRRDKQHIKATLTLLNCPPDQIDIRVLCNELDYFIARYEREEY